MSGNKVFLASEELAGLAKQSSIEQLFLVQKVGTVLICPNPRKVLGSRNLLVQDYSFDVWQAAPDLQSYNSCVVICSFDAAELQTWET